MKLMLCLSLGNVLGPLLAGAVPAQLNIPSALLQKQAIAPANGGKVAAKMPFYRRTDVVSGAASQDLDDTSILPAVTEIVDDIVISIPEMVEHTRVARAPRKATYMAAPVPNDAAEEIMDDLNLDGIEGIGLTITSPTITVIGDVEVRLDDDMEDVAEVCLVDDGNGPSPADANTGDTVKEVVIESPTLRVIDKSSGAALGQAQEALLVSLADDSNGKISATGDVASIRQSASKVQSATPTKNIAKVQRSPEMSDQEAQQRSKVWRTTLPAVKVRITKDDFAVKISPVRC